MIGQLPYGIRDCGPHKHRPEGVVLLAAQGGVLDIEDCWKRFSEDSAGCQVHDAVQNDGRHDVDEETGDFVQRVEDQTVPPHGDCDSVVAIG